MGVQRLLVALIGLTTALVGIVMAASSAAAGGFASPSVSATYVYDSPASTSDAPTLSVSARGASAGLAPGRASDNQSDRVTLGPMRVLAPLSRFGVAAEDGLGASKALVKSEWPANRGFLGDPVETTLKAGTRIDRYGGPGGTFASPEGTPFAARSLRSTAINGEYNVYDVTVPVSVRGGTVAPAFGYGGGGIQYEFSSPIQDLIDSGVLKRVGP